MLRFSIKLLTLALLLSVGDATVGNAASFDCNKATTETEIAICADPELSFLDEKLGATWASQERQPYEVKLQTNWLAKRNACEGNRTCITFYYNTHLQAFTQNEPLKCFEENNGHNNNFIEHFDEIDTDLNEDGSVDKVRFSISRYAEEFEIRLNVFLGPNICVPAYSWGDGIRNLDWASGFCSKFSGLGCVNGIASVNSSNSIVAQIDYYGAPRHGGIPFDSGTYTISLTTKTPRIVGYDFWPRNIKSGPEEALSFNFLSNLVTESLIQDAMSGGKTISERTVKYDRGPIYFPNGANFEGFKTVREFWKTRS